MGPSLVADETANLYLPLQGRCLRSIQSNSSDFEKDGCLNTDLGGPFQSLIELKPELEGEGVVWDQNQNLKHSESPKESVRFFYVPYLILKTSTARKDFIHLSLHGKYKT